MNTKQPFADLLAGLQQGKLSLVDIIGSLNARGPVQAPLHKAELGMLDAALAGKKIDEKLHRLLTAKLKEVQVPKATVEKTAAYSAYKAPAGNEDKTVAAGMGGEKTVMNPAGDKTRLNPAQQAGGAVGDKTVINPAGDKTVINPQASGNGADGDGFDLLIDQGGDSEATEMGDPQATTGFKPSEPATASRTGGTSGPSTSSWNRAAVSGAPDREVHAGDVLKERFKLEKEVGRGGMGIVFKAIDERKVEAQDKNPWVAVKVLNPEFRKHPQALVALQRESRKAQQLTHDNILRVYDFDKDGTVIYMTMEYCDAGALKDWIKKHPNGMGWEKGWPIIAGLARGLGRAHRDNIVHSDFKPGNVMMTTDGVPKLFDMGIARAAKSGAESKGETTVFDAGELGALTPAYASLEMIQGQPPELIDDIYALGITAYEILTGKHPFGKKNAEQAMKEGLKPPIVPGLQRAQQKTLQASVAFPRSARVKSCEDFLEGMRKRSIKDYAVPIMGAGVAAVLLLVGIFGGLLPYLSGKRVDAMIAQFSQAQFTDHAAAVAALNAMKPSERETAMQKGSKDIQNYFFAQAGARWDMAAKPPKYDHPAALAILNDAKALYPDSAAVSDNLEQLETQKNDQLKVLNTAFTEHVDANRIYEDKSPNIVETVAIVRQIDPANALLKDEKLRLRYANDVSSAANAKDYLSAGKRVTTAVKVFPDDKELLSLQASVKQGYELKLAEAKQAELMAKMTAAEAKAELMKLAANPIFTAEWQVGVNAAMAKLTGDTSADTMQAKTRLADAYAGQLAAKVDAKDLVGGQMIADNAKMFTGMPNLMKELGRLGEARKAQAAEDARKAALAEAETLKRTLKVNADANDIRGAQTALDKLRAFLPANDPFLSGDGPKALGQAYLRQANKQAEQQRYDAALKFVQDGLKAAPGLPALKEAEGTFRLEGSAQAVGTAAGDPASAKADSVKAALEVVRAADQTRYARVYNDAQNTVLSRLTALAKTDPAATKKAKDEWLKVFPQNTQLASLVIPEAAAPAATTSAAASTARPSVSTEARRARRQPGVDTCSPSFATFGKSSRASCQDDVNGVPGPRLVVVPGPAGGYFAITKYEITAAQFDAFCAATGKCKAQGGNDALPRTNVNFATAKAYAEWLSDQTGFNYRLPTDAEWQHAAGAGGAGAGDASGFNCVVMSGGSQIKGGFAVPATTGSANAWGLVNAIGNAAEYTDGGSVRGGHFNIPTSRCSVELREGGGENDTTGLRLVREMG